MKKRSIAMRILFLMMLFVGVSSAATTTSNTLSGVICSAWNATVGPNETLIEGIALLVSALIIGYESFQRVHMKHLIDATGESKGDELSMVMSHTMSIIIVTGVILAAIIGAFTIVSTMIC